MKHTLSPEPDCHLVQIRDSEDFPVFFIKKVNAFERDDAGISVNRCVSVVSKFRQREIVNAAVAILPLCKRKVAAVSADVKNESPAFNR